jgi:hypothetical protein
MARFETHFIYLLRDRESMRMGENVYKLGKTRQGTERLKGYSKSSELLLMIQVPDCDLLERVLLDEFRIHFVKRAERGAEYFEGDPLVMMNRILTHHARVAPLIDFSRHRDADAPAPVESLPAVFRRLYAYSPPAAPVRKPRRREPSSPSIHRASEQPALVDDEIASYSKAQVKQQLRERGEQCPRGESLTTLRARLRFIIFSAYSPDELEKARVSRRLPGLCDESPDDLFLRICLSYPR